MTEQFLSCYICGRIYEFYIRHIIRNNVIRCHARSDIRNLLGAKSVLTPMLDEKIAVNDEIRYHRLCIESCKDIHNFTIVAYFGIVMLKYSLVALKGEGSSLSEGVLNFLRS